MKRTRIAGHIWFEANLASAKGESAAANSIHIGNEWKAGGVEHFFERTMAFSQYRLRVAV